MMKKSDFTVLFIQFIVCVSIGIFAMHPYYEGAVAVAASLLTFLGYHALMEKRLDRIGRNDRKRLLARIEQSEAYCRDFVVKSGERAVQAFELEGKHYSELVAGLDLRMADLNKKVELVSKAMNISKLGM